MLKNWSFLFCCLLICGSSYFCEPAQAAKPQKHALVVGIGKYPKNSGWTEIHGNRDVDLVEEMLVNNGFPQENIIKLANKKATKAKINKELKRLARILRNGDVVYLHFSGHGQQVVDIDGDAPFGYDEAFIPYDAKLVYEEGVYLGENHLVDDELDVWLAELARTVGNRGQVIVVMDACHSGDGSLAPKNKRQVMRGTSVVFNMPEPEQPELSEDKRKRDRDKREWVCIKACGPDQNNFELKTDDGYFGRLTWALCRTISEGKSVGTLLKDIEELYQELPKVQGQSQNVSVDMPSGGARTILFVSPEMY